MKENTTIPQANENNTFMSVILNNNFRIVDTNKHCNKILGYSEKEIIGKSVFTTVVKSDREKLRSILEKVASGKEVVASFEGQRIRKDKTKIWVRSIINSIKTAENNNQLLLTCEDISSNKKYEERISKLHKCILNFEADSQKNLENITETAGKIFNSSISLYIRPEKEIVFSWYKNGKIKKTVKLTELIKISKKILTNSKSKITYIPDLHIKFPKIKTEFQSFLGKTIGCETKTYGQFCLLFRDKINFDDTELKFFDIFSSVINAEEIRSLSQIAFQENELRFKNLFENSTIGMYRSTPKGKIVFANPKFINLLGYDSLDELMKVDINKKIYLSVKSRERFKKILEEELTIHGYLENLKKKNGKIINVRESARIIKNKDGKILFYEGTVEDITLQKNFENKLIQSEEKFRSIYQSSGSGICIVNSKKKFVDANPKFCEIFGYKKEELLTKTFLDITHPDDLKKSIKSVEELFSGKEKQIQLEKKYIKKDGQTIWGSIKLNLLKDNTTDQINLLGVLEDITEKIRSINELKVKDEILSALSFSTETFLKTLDWQTNIQEILKRLSLSINVNRSYVFQNGHSNKEGNYCGIKYEWLGKGSVSKINDPSLSKIFYTKSGLQKLYSSLIKNDVFFGNTKDFSENERKFFGNEKNKSIIIIPIYESESLWGFMGFEDNRNERIWSNQEKETLKTAGNLFGVAIKRKIFEEELLKAKINAEKSDMLKSQFLAQISHEIRSPINSILSFSNLIKDEIHDKVNEELKQSFDIIESAGNRITRTIDLILNMSEIQTGTYEYISRKVDIYKDVLQVLHNEFKSKADSRGIQFELNSKTEDTIRVLDSYTVMQIFANLLDNAFKYTNKGKVQIAIKKNRSGKLEVTVEDTGIGMSAKYIPKLFRPFSQEEQGYTRKFEGNGLGLALVKNYCEMNNAVISVKSKKNVGTTFKVTFN